MVPVIGVEALVLMKLRASRPQDVADVAALLRPGADDEAIFLYLRAHAPELLPAFGRIAQSG